jgi:hypothetical protein
MAGDVIVHVDGDGNGVTVLCDPAEVEALREQQRERARRQAAEESRARANPYRYAEGGTAAFEAAGDRQSLVFAGWVAVPLLVAVVWAFAHIGLPGGLVTNVITLVLATMLVVAVLVVPVAVLVAIPALIHVAVLDGRDEKQARLRAESRERAERLARETAENDRRLAELGVDL